MDADGFIKKKNLDADGEHSTASTALMTPMRDIWGKKTENKKQEEQRRIFVLWRQKFCVSLLSM